MDIAKLAETYETYVISARRHIHENPELSWEEYDTTAFIEQELKTLGLSPRRFSCGTGLWADLIGGKATERSGTILLRADIDALPIKEATDAPYASKICEKMHACGHDCHVAMLLGAAKILCDVRDELMGRVRFLFQPAEETAQGAKHCIKDGVLTGVDAVYGCHVSSYVDAPYINIQPGARLASADVFKITVTGMAAHGSAPHCGKDAIVAAANIIMNLQLLPSRLNDPLNPLVVTVGKIEGGIRDNVIPDRVEMQGTVRTYSNKLRAQLGGMMQKLASDSAAALECEAEVEYTLGTGAVIHTDETLLRIGQEAAVKLYGSKALTTTEKVTASDDFADFMEPLPGLFPFIGIRNEAKGITYNHHNEHFDVDESALKRGAALYAQVAADYLESFGTNE